MSTEMGVHVGPIPSELIEALSPYVSRIQMHLLTWAAGNEFDEHEYFIEKISEYAARVRSMPVTYQQDAKGEEAIAYLHYFHGDSHWYITEKDKDGGIDQAFGLVILNGDTQNAELGYISIREIVQCGVELDLNFEPTCIGDIRRKHGI
jgi:hypothetical protein